MFTENRKMNEDSNNSIDSNKFDTTDEKKFTIYVSKKSNSSRNSDNLFVTENRQMSEDSNNSIESNNFDTTDDKKLIIDISKKSNSSRNSDGSSSIKKNEGHILSNRSSNRSSGRISSERLSERVGKSTLTLAGIFPIDEDVNSNKAFVDIDSNLPSNEKSNESLLIEKTSFKIEVAPYDEESLASSAPDQDPPLSEPMRTTTEQISDSLKIIREMLISPRGYEQLSNRSPEHSVINIRESQLHPPPVSQLNSCSITVDVKSNENKLSSVPDVHSPDAAGVKAATPSGAGGGLQSLLSPRLGLPKLSFYDFGYTKSIESFTKESRFASWTREELILVLIRNNIHIRKLDDISDSDLVEYCDDYFYDKKLPRKRGPIAKFQWSRLSRGR